MSNDDDPPRLEGVKKLPAGTVFVVDDDKDMRDSVVALARSAGLAAETYASAEQFLDRYDEQKPGCLVLDVRMPGMGGLELQKHLEGKAATLPIIFITAYGEIPLASETIRNGAVDFLQKPFSPQILLQRIQEALSLDRQTRQKNDLAVEIKLRIHDLTKRELQVMGLLVMGHSPKRIAAQLSISVKTVDNHRHKILEKMHVENATQLMRLLATIE